MAMLANREITCTECREPAMTGFSWVAHCEKWLVFLHQNCERGHHGLPPFAVKESGPGWDSPEAVEPMRYGKRGDPR